MPGSRLSRAARARPGKRIVSRVVRLIDYQDRCGYGPRLPLMVISPYAKPNFVDHKVTDQSSILRFIEDNWKVGRIGNQSFDAKAGSLENMFNFHNLTKMKV